MCQGSWFLSIRYPSIWPQCQASVEADATEHPAGASVGQSCWPSGGESQTQEGAGDRHIGHSPQRCVSVVLPQPGPHSYGFLSPEVITKLSDNEVSDLPTPFSYSPRFLLLCSESVTKRNLGEKREGFICLTSYSPSSREVA